MSELQPTFSVIIPWSDRPVIEESLKANKRFLERDDTEIVIVGCGDQVGRLPELILASGARNVRALSVPVEFSRALCLNLGSSKALGEYLFFLDADIVLRSDVLCETSVILRERKAYATICKIDETDPEAIRQAKGLPFEFLSEMIQTIELKTADGRRAVLRTYSSPAAHPGDGLVIVSKADVYGTGGLNARLDGWGYEDTDFQIRLQFQLGLERIESGYAVHLTHLGSFANQELWQRNMLACARNYRAGNYQGTLAADIATWTASIKAIYTS